jgi:hypothetical protein
VAILACSNAASNHKLKLAFIGKAKKPQPFKNLAPDALSVHIRTRRMHGWIQKFSEAGFSVNLFLQ